MVVKSQKDLLQLFETKKHNIAPDADMVAASMEAQVFFGSHRALCLPAYD